MGDLSVRTGEQIIEAQPIPERGVTLFGTDDPVEVVRLAQRVSDALSPIIEDQKLFKEINGKKHVFVEGWTMCGSMLGVFPIGIWTRAIEGGFEARVEARLRDGSLVGAAEAQCTRAEPNWASRNDNAIRSMAQTRATSKALRLPLGFIVAMKGYSATPAEEMDDPNGGHINTAKAPAHVPAPAPRAAAIPRTQTDRTNSGEEFVIMEISELKEIKRGESKNGEEWVIFAINGMTDTGHKFSGTAFENDDNHPVQDAEALFGKVARVHFKRNGKYVNVTRVEAA